jgi:DNA-directed RNA polymerase subunit beta'
MVKEHNAKADANPNNLHLMMQAGVKPSPDQYRQLTLAPMLLTDAASRILPKPVTKSYSEGLGLGDYWNQMSGARRGSVVKVQEVQGPGFFTKQLMNTSIGSQVSKDNCGTSRGVVMKVSDQNIHDRDLAHDLVVKGTLFKKGTTLTPDIVQTIRSVNPNVQVSERSPLRCEHGPGICQKCAGRAPDGDYYKMGTNVGVLSTQALGERATQLMLKSFHSAGVAARDGGLVNDFKRVLELTRMPQHIPNAATLAMKSGTVTKVEKDPTGVNVWVGNTKHHVAKDRYGSPLWKPVKGAPVPTWKPPKVGMHIEAGHMLSDPTRTNVNIRDLYKATNSIDRVQDHLVNELHGIYGKENVRRQHVELVVKNISNLTRVVDPGDDTRSIKGEFTSTSNVHARNRALAKQGLSPIKHTPVLKGINVLPLEVQEDWMAKMNHEKIRDTVIDAATYGHASNLHGTNPIPSAAYGAEFGLTHKDRFKKPHVAGVPDWGY